MSRRIFSEEQAKLEFAARLNEEARLARLNGADPEGKRRLAEIVAENESECEKIEQELSPDVVDDSLHR